MQAHVHTQAYTHAQKQTYVSDTFETYVDWFYIYTYN